MGLQHVCLSTSIPCTTWCKKATQINDWGNVLHLLLHGTHTKSPAELISQVDHERIYPLRLARVWYTSDDCQLARNNLHKSHSSVTQCLLAVILCPPHVHVVSSMFLRRSKSGSSLGRLMSCLYTHTHPAEKRKWQGSIVRGVSTKRSTHGSSIIAEEAALGLGNESV